MKNNHRFLFIYCIILWGEKDSMKNNIIKCPNCGWEYLPGEIYLPKHFLGQPKEIERTIDGKILLHYGTDPDLNEIFRCEHCGNCREIW